MSDLSYAIILSICISVLLSFIQLGYESKIYHVKSYFTWLFCFYISIMILGNVATTLVASNIIENYITEAINKKAKSIIAPKDAYWIWYSFVGVFGFEALIQKINITFFDQGVLSINEWITKAKNSAVEATLAKAADIDIYIKQHLANELIKKYSSDLNQIHIIAKSNLGIERYDKIIAAYGTNNLEHHLAYVLANEATIRVKAILKIL